MRTKNLQRPLLVSKIHLEKRSPPKTKSELTTTSSNLSRKLQYESSDTDNDTYAINNMVNKQSLELESNDTLEGLSEELVLDDDSLMPVAQIFRARALPCLDEECECGSSFLNEEQICFALITLTLEALKLEEMALLEARAWLKMKSNRLPWPRWYEYTDERFHKEYKRNSDHLSNGNKLKISEENAVREYFNVLEYKKQLRVFLSSS